MFVHDLACRLAQPAHGFGELTVLAPHAPGAARRERMGPLEVVRYAYAPAPLEQLAYDGGILARLREARWRLALVPGFLAAQTLALRQLLRERRFDVVHAHWLVPQGVAALAALATLPARRRPALVTTSHGGDLFGLRDPLSRALERRVVAASAHTTVVSEAMRTVCLEALGADPARVSVLPMGVDLHTRFTPPERADTRQPNQLVFVGRLVEKKGVRHLLDAMPAVRRAVPRARLTLVGDGPLRAALEAHARALGLGEEAVCFVGARPLEAVPGFYRRAAVAVMPSVVARGGDQEGLGLVAVEAMGCEAAVVASALPAVHDAVEDGVSGLLVPPGDAAALAAAIVRLLEDPALARALATRGRRAALERFDAERVAERYAALLQAAAAASRR